jgi:hypothetical protein
MGFASEVGDIEDFLSKHSENVDLNEYNEEGRTALQQSCFDGNLQLAQVLHASEVYLASCSFNYIKTTI